MDSLGDEEATEVVLVDDSVGVNKGLLGGWLKIRSSTHGADGHHNLNCAKLKQASLNLNFALN